MWTGKLKYAIALGALVLLSACVSAEHPPAAAEKPLTAWWLKTRFEPTGQSVAGVPISRLDHTWAAANELTREALASAVSSTDLQQLSDTPLTLSLRADLDGNGEPERYLVGVYRTTTGDTGRFLAVVADPASKPRILVDPGMPAFSALLVDGKTIHWYKCLQCGEYEVVRWSKGRLVLE